MANIDRITEPALLCRAEVQARLKVSKSFIFSNIERGTFPKPLKIGPRAFRWRVEDIDSYLDECAAARDEGVTS